MTKQELKQKITEVMNWDSEKANAAYEKLAEAVFDSIDTDDEAYRKIGFYLLKSFLQDEPDDTMIALCGWSFETLMVKAGILPDTEKIFTE